MAEDPRVSRRGARDLFGRCSCERARRMYGVYARDVEPGNSASVHGITSSSSRAAPTLSETRQRVAGAQPSRLGEEGRGGRGRRRCTAAPTVMIGPRGLPSASASALGEPCNTHGPANLSATRPSAALARAAVRFVVAALYDSGMVEYDCGPGLPRHRGSKIAPRPGTGGHGVGRRSCTTPSSAPAVARDINDKLGLPYYARAGRSSP